MDRFVTFIICLLDKVLIAICLICLFYDVVFSMCYTNSAITFNMHSSVSPGLNEVRGAHDDEQPSVRPGAPHGVRREARAAGRTSREGARRNVRPDAPNKNDTIIKHNKLIVNKRQTIRFVLLQCHALYVAH